MAKSSVADVLTEANEQLRNVSRGLEMMQSSNGAARAAGLHRVVVFGRAVTSALQNLKSQVSDFAGWYDPWQARLMADPVASRFYQMRSKILHEGETNTRSGILLNGTFDPEEITKAGPAGTIGAFAADTQGRSGFVVKLPDGSTERIYDELPEDQGFSTEVTVHLRDLPEGLCEKDVRELAEGYATVLKEMVDDAHRQFS